MPPKNKTLEAKIQKWKLKCRKVSLTLQIVSIALTSWKVKVRQSVVLLFRIWFLEITVTGEIDLNGEILGIERMLLCCHLILNKDGKWFQTQSGWETLPISNHSAARTRQAIHFLLPVPPERPARYYNRGFAREWRREEDNVSNFVQVGCHRVADPIFKSDLRIGHLGLCIFFKSSLFNFNPSLIFVVYCQTHKRPRI